MSRESNAAKLSLDRVLQILESSDQTYALADVMTSLECFDPKIVIDSLVGKGVYYSPDYGFFGKQVSDAIKLAAEEHMRQDVDQAATLSANELGGTSAYNRDTGVRSEHLFGMGVKEGVLALKYSSLQD